MKQSISRLAQALGSGLIGAAALTVLHETTRHLYDHAPRMDVLGMRSLAKGMRFAGIRRPRRNRLHHLAMAGDLLSNSLYYSLVAAGGGRKAWLRGSLLGLGAGLGAVFLPPVLGLGRQPGARYPTTHLLTVAWYLFGGLTAAAAARLMTPSAPDRPAAQSLPSAWPTAAPQRAPAPQD